MEPLQKLILEKIHASGPVTFAEFMGTALYHPGLGYYTSGGLDIGTGGDFYTSPHLHPAFGALLARQVEEMWEILGKPSDFAIVEIGGGRGYLAKDILDYLQDRELYGRLAYRLIEMNPRMKQRQEKLLSNHAGKIIWEESISGAGGVVGCVISNEVMDALPVHLIETGGGISEVHVDSADGRLKETLLPPGTAAINEYLDEFRIRLPQPYRTEIHLALKPWLKSVSDILQEGFVLSIDYGYSAREYYSEDRDRGTLACYFRHTVNYNPYLHIGKQDITAHVNFSALKAWGEQFGLKCVGYCRQGPFLVSAGLEELLTELYENAPDYPVQASRIKGLVMPGGMGDTHKVMVQFRGRGEPGLRGFTMKNQANVL